jgi:hypothetical protein
MSHYSGSKLYRLRDPDMRNSSGKYEKRLKPIEAEPKKLERAMYKGIPLEFLASPGQRINLKKEAKRQIAKAQAIRDRK